MVKLGSIQLNVPFVQAALSGYSDLAFRRLARRYGAPYTLNEVVLDRLVVQAARKNPQALQVPDGDHPVGGQLMGANPDDFGPAAALLAEAGYDVIDINFGCPVKKVLGRCRGGFLLSQPKTALEIVRRVYDAAASFSRPVTVKMRRGLDDSPRSERNFFAILEGAFEIGVTAVTVHGRTVEQRYVGPSHWPFLAEVKRRAGDRQVLGSGDLFSAADCVRMIEETGVDGVTIARGCIGYPWIFRECRALWDGTELPPPPSVEEQKSAITWHFDQVLQVHGPVRGPRIMRKFGIKYAEHHPCGQPVRDAFIAVRSAEDFRLVLETWYDPGRDWPAVSRPAAPGHLIAAGAAL